MDGKSRLLNLLIVFVVVCALITACRNNEKDGKDTKDTTANDKADVTTQDDALNETLSPSDRMTAIYDKDDNKLGEIDGRALCTAVDDGIFYSIFRLGENEQTATAQYRLFRKSDNTDILLGNLKDQGYEAQFCRTEYNGRIYTLAIQGYPIDKEKDDLILLEFDPKAGTMKKHVISHDGFPYGSMAFLDGKLLIMNHETLTTKESCIYEYDPATESVRTVINIPDDQGSLRAVSVSGDNVYLFRWKGVDGGEPEIYLDQYDKNFQKKSEKVINDVLAKAIVNVRGIMSRADAINELGYYITHLEITDDRYLHYENFAVTRVIVDLQTEDTIFSQDDLYNGSNGGGATMICRYSEDIGSAASSEIYRYENGELKPVEVHLPEHHKLVRYISSAPGGSWLVTAVDVPSASSQTEAVYLFSMP